MAEWRKRPKCMAQATDDSYCDNSSTNVIYNTNCWHIQHSVNGVYNYRYVSGKVHQV